MNILGRLIHELMRNAGRHFEALPFLQCDTLTIRLDNRATAQNEKELTSG